jgi:hypothetical protein
VHHHVAALGGEEGSVEAAQDFSLTAAHVASLLDRATLSDLSNARASYSENVQNTKKTIDFGTVYRCMLVGLDDETARACKAAVRPLEAVNVEDTREACARMSEVLPLVVARIDSAEERETAEMQELLELAGACGAEVVTIVLPLDVKVLGGQILEALRKGEKRRMQK